MKKSNLPSDSVVQWRGGGGASTDGDTGTRGGPAAALGLGEGGSANRWVMGAAGLDPRVGGRRWHDRNGLVVARGGLEGRTEAAQNAMAA